jgi:hypothetical protein
MRELSELRRGLAVACGVAVCSCAASSAEAGEIRLASRGFAPDFASNGASTPEAVSADGRFVAFWSHATDIVSGGGDTNGVADAFLWDRLTSTTTLISHTVALPGFTANGSSYPAAITPDGRYVLVQSNAVDLISGATDLNSTFDLFLWDRNTNSMTLVSRAEDPDPSPVAANGASEPVAMSADGRYVAFRSNGTNLVQNLDANGEPDAFLWDRVTDAMTLVSHAAGVPTMTGDAGSYPAALSADGRYMAFYSGATNLVAGVTDENEDDDAFLWDRDTNTTRLISRSATSATTTANGSSDIAALAMSVNGRYVTFSSWATNLISGGVDTNDSQDAFLWDRDSGLVVLVSHAAGSLTTTADDFASPTSISADGRYVTLDSMATDLVAGGSDTNSVWDVFVWDRDTGIVKLVSHVVGAPTTAAAGFSNQSAISADGRNVKFRSTAVDLLGKASDPNGSWDAFLWRRASGEVTLTSRSTANEWTAGNAPSEPDSLSADGWCVTLKSTATDLMPGTFNGVQQVFLACPFNLFSDGFESGTTGWWSHPLP